MKRTFFVIYCSTMILAFGQSVGNVRMNYWNGTSYVTGTWTGSGVAGVSGGAPQTIAISGSGEILSSSILRIRAVGYDVELYNEIGQLRLDTSSGQGIYLYDDLNASWRNFRVNADIWEFGVTGGTASFYFGGITDNREYNFPNSTGTVAVTLSGTKTMTVSTLSTLTSYEELIPIAGASTTGTPSISVAYSGTLPNGLLEASRRVVATGTVGITLYNSTGIAITATTQIIRATVIYP